MGQGYYYTLSAIAQSFAAVMALDAIFVIFKLKVIQDTKDDLLLRARRLIAIDWTADKHRKCSESIIQQNVNNLTRGELLFWFRTGDLESDDSQIKLERDTLIRDMTEICQYRDAIMNWLYVTLVLNSVTILASLILLPWGNIRCTTFQVIVIIVMLVLGAFTLFSTIHAIIITIGGNGIRVICHILMFLLPDALPI